jgi:hypothetical protein
MLQNPFSETPVLPPDETDPVEDKKLVKDFLGPEAAEQFARLDDRTYRPKADDSLNLEEADDFKNETKIERLLDIDRQYAEQKGLLISLGLLEGLSTGEQGIRDEQGNEYPFPTLKQVKQEVSKNQEVFAKKAEQGFTELRITPFALPIQRLFTAIEEELKIQHDKGTLHSTDGTKLTLDTKESLSQWPGYRNQTPVYFPTDLEKTNHGGKTKPQLLDSNTSSFPGFLVSFEESSPNIPREGQGETIGGRPQLEAGLSPKEYFNLLKTKPYEHESGLTIEDWAIRFLSALHKDGTVIDDWDAKDADDNENASACLNFATLFPEEGEHGVVSFAVWIRGGHLANAVGLDVTVRGSVVGSRSSVRVGSL